MKRNLKLVFLTALTFCFAVITILSPISVNENGIHNNKAKAVSITSTTTKDTTKEWKKDGWIVTGWQKYDTYEYSGISKSLSINALVYVMSNFTKLSPQGKTALQVATFYYNEKRKRIYTKVTVYNKWAYIKGKSRYKFIIGEKNIYKYYRYSDYTSQIGKTVTTYNYKKTY